MNNALILLPIFFPFLSAILLLFSNFSEKIRNIFVGVTVFINLLLVIGITNYFGESSFHLLRVNEFLDIYFKVDKISILFSVLVSILWFFTSIYSMEYMKHEGKEKKFFIYFIITLGITLGIAFSGNLITLYFFYEFLTLATFPLVIHSGSKEALASGKKYLIYSFTGATFILFGMILLFSVTNNLNFIPGGILKGLDNYNSMYSISYILMFIGFGVKAALVPFHSWLPNAMVAPTPVSALLHAVAVVKSGVFSLIRITFYVFGTEAVKEVNGTKYLIVFVIISILMGSFLALHQENLKKRLAYSTISQLGYILLGILLLNKDSFIGGMMHLINHAVIKITLFFCVGAIMYTTHKTEINEIKGIGKQMPIIMWCFTISAISLIGIPPTNGFVSKWFLAQGGLTEGKAAFPAILLLSALLTAMYLLPVVTAAFFKKGDDKVVVLKKEAPKKMLIPIISITVITVILGLFPNPILAFVSKIAEELI
ncbi:complex I subunit 5 family protein [Clostridium rectalis]|uniref:complex I subunit 5 family protein n=1 Tax=Clostridium rectalis TaxID=2040295 RepID=UPI000F62C391|nr:proton-conducting transporter membrane subunit [Clostridium rectalis]